MSQPIIILTPVKSSHIKAIGHSGTTMHVEYSDGGLYEHTGVPGHAHAELMAAQSKGKHLRTLAAKYGRGRKIS
jgi:hypothetical protein